MKNLFYTFLLISPLLFISSCEEDNQIEGCRSPVACNYDSLVDIHNLDLCEFPGPVYDCEGNILIGAYTHGGIVFYVDETGQHGLVAAEEDLEETYEWGCFEENVLHTNGNFGHGYESTMAIVNQGCETENGGITAAQATVNAEINGYTDWYLPSFAELSEMYFTIGHGVPNGSPLVNEGGFSTVQPTSIYLSSSEAAGNTYLKARAVEFDGDDSSYSWLVLKSTPYSVRPIRSF